MIDSDKKKEFETNGFLKEFNIELGCILKNLQNKIYHLTKDIFLLEKFKEPRNNYLMTTIYCIKIDSYLSIYFLSCTG